MGIDTGFWRGRRVLVTGHTGFKGGWLCLWFRALGAEVTGYALAPDTDPSLFEAAGVADGLVSRIGDVRDAAALRAAVRDAAPSVVLHLAAQSLVRRSYDDPLGTYATNVMGTANVLEAVRHAPGVRAVLLVTSDKCYENRDLSRGYREDDPVGGWDPYSSSKGCAELVTAAYRRSFFGAGSHRAAVASARAGNVIGGGDWAQDRLVPDLVRAFLAGRPARIRYPDATRPWQHVLDVLAGYLQLAQRLVSDPVDAGESWNFGPAPETAVPVSRVAELFTAQWDDGARWETDAQTEHPHEARALVLDASKAGARLGWRPALDLRATLEWTARWYRAHAAGKDMGEFTAGQIRQYMQLAGGHAQ